MSSIEFEDEEGLLADDMEDAGRRAAELVHGSLADIYDGLVEESGRALETIEESIEDHPWLSLFAGLGIGFLIGSALFRRN